MAKYIALINWTEQGIKNVKDAPKRVDGVRALAKKNGCEMQELYMTVGIYDMVSIIEAPNDEAAAKLLLTIGSAGNVRTTTLKAFPEDAFRKIIGSL